MNTPETRLCAHHLTGMSYRDVDLVEDLIGKKTFTEVMIMQILGREARPVDMRIVDAVLVTLMEHGLTPSAIATRLIYMSAPENLQGAVASGLMAVGSQFVGTMENCSRLLDRIRQAADGRAEALAIAQEFRASRQPLPGFGHHLHKPDDPRSIKLLALAEAEPDLPGDSLKALRLLAAAIDETYGKHITINATGAVAALLSEIGVPTALMRGFAVISRAAGLVSHVAEEQQSPSGRFIWENHRPRHSLRRQGQVAPARRRTVVIPPAPGARLAGKIALVAGAGSSAAGWSIGKASCVTLARQGAAIIALDADRAAAEDAAHEVERAGGQALPVQADVADADAMRAAVDAALAHYGRIDVLQANAGIGKVGGPEDIDLADWDRIQRVNVTSLLIATRLLAPVMRAQGGGAIVTVSSIAGIRYTGYPHLAYSVSKAAVIHFARMAAQQYAADGIRVNTVIPGLIDTPRVARNVAGMFAKDDLEAARKARDRQVPMGRMGTPWEVANAVAFLASDEASYITGTELLVDGGLTGKYA